MKKKEFLLALAGFGGSAVLLTIIQAPVALSILAPAAYVPIILISSPQMRIRTLLAAGYPVCLLYWLVNLYWVCPVTWPGWIAFCGYSGILWPVLSVCIRYCRARRWPLLLAAAVAIVGVERLQGLFLGGFFWRFLAHSQYANTALIQIADIFGAGGVSFLIAAINGLTAELILARRENRLGERIMVVKAAITVAAVVLAVVYGRWRIAQTDAVIEQGPRVGSVQSNVPQSVKQTFESSEEILDGLLAQSRQCSEFGADLILWPETMVQATINDEVLALIDRDHPFNRVDEVLREHARDNAYLLVGAYTGKPRVTIDGKVQLTEKYNSVLLYTNTGEKLPRLYSKIHLVPFGEVLPFKHSAPWLYSLLMKMTPYDYDYSLDYGRSYTIFELPADGQRPWRFGVLICYEDTVPAIGRRFAMDDKGQKAVDWLVNVSNDGWFVRYDEKSGKVYGRSELGQHTAICAFRAIENRLAVIRSVNTGISCLIDSAGRIQDGFIAGNLPDPAMNRTAVEGWFVDTIPIDRRITFFSRYGGQWLDFCCTACVLTIIILPPLLRWVRTKKGRWFMRSVE